MTEKEIQIKLFESWLEVAEKYQKILDKEAYCKLVLHLDIDQIKQLIKLLKDPD